MLGKLDTIGAQPLESIAYNEHYDGDGATVFKHACALGCEGIVSKRLGSPYRSGRVDENLSGLSFQKKEVLAGGQ